MLKRKPKQFFPLRKDPGDPERVRCSPGSIEQELDMCEEGSLRGDESLRHGDEKSPPPDGDPWPLDRVLSKNYNTDLSEEGREGDEDSGDEHSSGYQGGDPSEPGSERRGPTEWDLSDLEKWNQEMRERRP